MNFILEEDLIKELKEMAERYNASHKNDFYVDDYSVGNIDDAYELGRNHSEIDMAQWVLTALGIDWEYNNGGI